MLLNLLLSIFHWQLHLILIIACMNNDADDLYKELIEDEIRLSKIQLLILNVT